MARHVAPCTLRWSVILEGEHANEVPTTLAHAHRVLQTMPLGRHGSNLARRAYMANLSAWTALADEREAK